MCEIENINEKQRKYQFDIKFHFNNEVFFN